MRQSGRCGISAIICSNKGNSATPFIQTNILDPIRQSGSNWPDHVTIGMNIIREQFLVLIYPYGGFPITDMFCKVKSRFR